MKIVALGSVQSTNRYCEALDLSQVEDFTCFYADNQTAGIGQRGNKWHAEQGKSLAFSLVLHPRHLAAEAQFRLTQMLSLAVVDCLSALQPSVRADIKWPNDIYVDGCKLAGMLISVRLHGGEVESAVCGIGLNVGSMQFPQWVPNPVSLAQLGVAITPRLLLERLLAAIERRYALIDSPHALDEPYLAALWRRGVRAAYSVLGERIEAMLQGVDPFGRLLLVDEEGRQYCCGLKEVVFL